jgi:dihydroorotate dehydrogenase
MIISAPFGNYHKFLKMRLGDIFTPTLGTFTLKPRGFFTTPYGDRWTRVLLSLRYSFFLKSWINKIGLKNNGISSCEKDVGNKIISVHGFTDYEWITLVEEAAKLKPLAIELNVSCPNVGETFLSCITFAKMFYYANGVELIVKLPPVGYRQLAEQAHIGGIRTYHACNTIPTARGGISGKALLPLSLEVVNYLKQTYTDIKIIGGGGITCKEDVKLYKQMGADDIAIGTVLFNPFNWKKVKEWL